MKASKRSGAAASLAALLSLPAAAAADDRIAIGPFAGAHVFNDDNELGTVDESGAPALRSGVAFGLRAAYALVGPLALEGELAIVPTRVRGTGIDVVQTNWRLAAIVDVGDGRLRPYALLGLGGATAQSSDARVLMNDTDLVGQAGAGLKLAGGPGWGARLDARLLLPPSSASEGLTAEWEATLGIYRTFGDAPPAPAPAPAAAPAVADAPDPDADADHVKDADDRCPDQPENVNSFEDDDGCPDQDPDADADGVTGAADRCADAAEDKDGFQDDDGCPDLDNDGDGVADAGDRCPAELESPNGYKDDDGCADAVPPELAAIVGVVAQVRFAKGTSKLAGGSRRALDGVAKVLAAAPDVAVEVSAHVGAATDPAAAVALTTARAEVAKAYLVSKGVAAERIAAVGKGDQAPAGGPTNSERLELRLVSPSTPPTPSP